LLSGGKKDNVTASKGRRDSGEEKMRKAKKKVSSCCHSGKFEGRNLLKKTNSCEKGAQKKTYQTWNS